MPYCFDTKAPSSPSGSLKKSDAVLLSLFQWRRRSDSLRTFYSEFKKTLHFLTGLYFPQILRSADLVGCVCRTLFPFYAFCFSNPVAAVVVAAAAAGHSRCSPLVGFRLPMTSFHFLFDNVSVISLSNSLAFACCRMCLTTTLFIYTSFVFLYTVTGVFVIL